GGISTGLLASMERLNPEETVPVWQLVAEMSNPRNEFGVAVLDNVLYAVGGHSGGTYLKTVER
ncbi:hypothetical protein TELCIR_22549, partial [Teladorsagia circumcincta]